MGKNNDSSAPIDEQNEDVKLPKQPEIEELKQDEEILTAHVEKTKPKGKKDDAMKKKDKEWLKQIEELEAKNKEVTEQYLRLAAEFDNFRKRSQQEKERLYSNSITDVVTELLPVLDNVERAYVSATETGSEPAVLEGLQMILNQVKETFKKFEVEEIDCLHQKFDPNTQSAVMHIEDEQYGESIVSEVFQKGFKRGDKVIRHSMVQVAN